MVQALAGLAVDVVTVCGVAILAHVAPSALLAGVFWRVALLSATDIAVNLLASLLQLDGQWALADYLDEPDLAARARAGLGRLLRGGGTNHWWLPLYGAAGLIGGLALLLGSGYIWWIVVDDLLTSLFTGNLAEIVVGVLLVGPTAIGLLVSIIGVISDALPIPLMNRQRWRISRAPGHDRRIHDNARRRCFRRADGTGQSRGRPGQKAERSEPTDPNSRQLRLEAAARQGRPSGIGGYTTRGTRRQLLC